MTSYCAYHASDWKPCFDVRCEKCPNRQEFYPLPDKGYGLIYLATPYSKYKGGIEAAFRDASKLAADLLRAGHSVYSPIAHTHPLAIHGNIDPLDHNIWLPFDSMMMDKANTLFVALMDGWYESYGVRHEIEVFRKAGKPILYVRPHTLDLLDAAA